MKTVLVTGASGFVGRTLCARLLAEGLTVRGTILPSESSSSLVDGVTPVVVEPLCGTTRWDTALAGIDTIIHLAARVHVMEEFARDPLKEFRIANTDGTARLAREAAAARVQRFVFMSTIGVNGESSGKRAFTEKDEPAPHNAYSVSKWEAESILAQIALPTILETVIIRAPLVYGPGNPGNFLSLLKVVSRGFPLPLGLISNKRSLLYIGNLVDALLLAASHPKAVGKTYLVSDGDDVSTPELIKRTAAALGVNVPMFPFPLRMMVLLGAMCGKSKAIRQLFGSLTVDSSSIRRELGWVPPYTLDQGLKDTAAWFQRNR